MKQILFFFILISFNTIIGQTVLGIDVSHHQGTINWQLVANDGKVFAYCKATEGMTYHDPNFTSYISQGKAAGIVMGAYHFARPDNNTAIQDADNFINQAHNYIGNGYLPPVLDFEDPNSSTHLDQLYSSQYLTNWIQTWLNRVETQTGVKPILYLNTHYANFLQSSLNRYGLWIAKPNSSPTAPPGDIGHWNDWMVKQYSWYGSVNGISGNVDLNVFNGSNSDFNNMISTNNVQILNPASIKVYPNPTNSILHIVNKNEIDIKQMSLYDISGSLILNYDRFKRIFNLQDLEKGFYILKIKFNNGQTQKIKVLKN